jgi:hypothetical protein
MVGQSLLAADNNNSTEKPNLEIADIFRMHGQSYRQNNGVSFEQQKVMNAILQCRTAALGGHLDQCDNCDATEISYNSCRNRHCPKCQTVKKLQWIKQREAELLPVLYFHVVFTLPHELNAMVYSNQALMYDLLFKAASETLLAFGHDTKRLGGELAAIMVLHTWGQTMTLHPHLHAIVPGGALTESGEWVEAKSNYLFPVKAMAKHFRANYLKRLQQYYTQGKLAFHGASKVYESPAEFNRLKERLWKKDWITYAKKPFAGPKQIIQYLSSYTHRIAISNHRLISCENGKVKFKWRDYADGNKTKVMTLNVDEFMRRYLQHVLPPRLTRIRQIGFLANRYKADKLQICRAALEVQAEPVIKETADELLLRVCDVDINRCQHCDTGKKRTVLTLLKKYDRSQWPDTA